MTPFATTPSVVGRTWGACYGYLLVTAGRAEVMVDDPLSPWDAASLIPFISEAASVHPERRRGGWEDGIATARHLSEVLRQGLARAG